MTILKRKQAHALAAAATLAAAILLSFASCSGGGSKGGAGIGGSGYKASGTVSEFGSIFVNGVEFETSAATFEIEGGPGSQADLRVGMRVVVEGSLDPGGTSGTALRVRFEDELEGPIPASSTINEDADEESKRFTILGVPIDVSRTDTVFVGSNFSYGTLAPGDNLQISGFYDAAGLLHATALVRKSAFAPNATIVEAKGTITSLAANSFTLRAGATSLTVDTSMADLSGVPGGLAVGQRVEAKGTIASDTATSLIGTAVKLEESFSDGLEVELEGLITRFASANSFDVDGTPVNATAATLAPSTMTLALGLRVEVEGKIKGGTLQATAVKLREGDVQVRATASNVNTTANTFDLTLAGQTVSVTANTSTQMRDKTSGAGLSLATLSLVDGRFLRVRGYADGTGSGLVASRIDIDTPRDARIQAVITSQVIGTSVTLLGVTFPVDASTEFQDTTNAPFAGGQTAFASSTTPGVSLIKVTDKSASKPGNQNPVGVADEVELQTP
ncbi:MAG: hypothetical protein JKY65_32710 [Planctomycetes bacterium]|nr:hypothetical protein [Planctomycetota bacterium]